MKSKPVFEGGPVQRPRFQRGMISKPEQMNLKTILQVPTAATKKLMKRFWRKKMRRVLNTKE